VKYLFRFLLLLFILVGVLIAVSNTQTVSLALWPLPQVVMAPLYLLVVALLLLGVLVGLIIGWWAARHHRRRGRKYRAEAERLDRELAQARQALAAHATGQRGGVAGSAATGPSYGSRALERQVALVAPDPMQPHGRLH
jgi:uncharacterized integral membrane protein